ncbi:HIT family protein [Occultella kanbiaonis]|uniref:HIT family protein n=1 Tax=Occultella kanbiaonis TaxID=2675754 RepID=UPI0012B82CAB|nr:HIT family protein [Occultella kanbiaonis]
MATLFTRIIDGDIPGRFVWADAICVAFLTIEPRQLGHTMVVPRAEVDQWVDLPADVAAHVFAVAQTIGVAQRSAFDAQRIGVLIEGYEVPHAHVHVWPSRSPADFDLRSVMRDIPDADADRAAATLREQLRRDGHAEFVPEH